MQHREPAFALVYGPSKVGKTTDALYSFSNGFFLAPPGALKPAVGVVGFEVPEDRVYDPKSIPDACNKLQEIAKSKRCTVAVVDDFSLLAERSLALLEARTGKEKLVGWELWNALAGEVLDFRDTGRRLGMHVVMNAHEKAPDPGKGRRGGPKLPGQLVEAMPTACDMVLRAVMQSNIGGNGRVGWQGTYRCAPWDNTWVTGDRHNATPDYAPMNLGELLRAAGFVIPRLPGTEWIEDAVAAASNDMIKGGGPQHDKAFIQHYATALLQQYRKDPLHVRWFMRDAFDRTAIRRARSNPFSLFGL